MSAPTLGIMTCKRKQLFSEKGYFKLLQKFGDKNNIKTFVFYPDSIDIKKRKVTGYRYNFHNKKWDLIYFSLPDFIYDRCFYGSTQQYKNYKPFVKFLKQQNCIKFLGNGLKGKWEVYQILSSNLSLKKYLPHTVRFSNFEQLDNLIKTSPIILKPATGSHGKGIIKITYIKGEYFIIGRNSYNKKIKYLIKNKKNLHRWILNFTNGRSYLIQEYLKLNNSKKMPYDIRMLIQKNELGKWEITGSAARLGDANNITSNLHGGGTVKSTTSLLTSEFGKEKAIQLEKELDKLGNIVPNIIESSHGNLFELGLDIGIDVNGNLWIIEANSKPGRKIFTLLKDKDKNHKSIIQPILYTKYLSKKYSNK